MIKRAIHLSGVSLLLMFSAKSQDTVWISKSGRIITSKDSADRYNLIYKNKIDTQEVKVVSCTLDGVAYLERNYYPFFPKMVFNGPYRVFDNGILKIEKHYKNDTLHGPLKVFWENGKLRRNEIYDKGKLIQGNCYTSDGADTAYFEHEIRARFPGGMDSLVKFIRKTLHYPSAAKSDGIEGTVYVAFTITKEGAVTDVFIRKGVHPYLDKQVMLLMSKMPRWIPARQEDKLVSSTYTLPVTFYQD